ncbi:sarcosine oxidase [Lineolata rhizophorae]|uniref:Sarcosine oxidase n=1 Tax=Lineolata rhizophorae TaxID=578093 RepID=A0A6A6NY12_9PEZI|nr:sarcosine oxidase [Lineolata rhizophorae]
MARSFVIVGAGNFGAATALELVTQHPMADVALIDTSPFPNPQAASHDINKIIRPDYSDPAYTRLMAEAMPLWRASPLYSAFYHETGVLRADPSHFSDACFDSYDVVGSKTAATWLSVDEVRRRWNGVFRHANLDGVDKCYWNPKSGWAEADRALEAVIRDAVSRGVRYYSDGVQTLLIGADGTCRGVRLKSGAEMLADSVVLSAGARTALLLAESAPDNREIQAGDRIVATGAVSFYATLEGVVRDKFREVPVFKSCLKQAKGESISLASNGILKFNCDLSFTNMGYHVASGQLMSIPPEGIGQGLWNPSNFPQALKDRCKQVLANLYGEMVDGVEIEAYRMCWDATTPSHDFLIGPHPHCKNLYILTGGSFHGWKFLPIIGKYTVQMLNGTLEESLQKKWSWTEGCLPWEGHKANPTYQLEADLKDFADCLGQEINTRAPHEGLTGAERAFL